MPKRTDIHSILIIGSGPIVIGQACEFDYSGTQACRVLRDEGYRVILANSNPATIMTDPDFADATYVEPLTWEVVCGDHRAGTARRRAADARRPDRPEHRHGAVRARPDRRARHARDDRRQRRGDRHRRGPRDVQAGDDRDRPRRACGRARPTRWTRPAWSIADIGLPRIIRPAYILGGRGTGIAVHRGGVRAHRRRTASTASPISEILIEESIAGWKEYELEVMRDRADNCVIICSIENVDPMGVHTGDSITVAPIQTLTDVEYQADARRGVRVHPARRRGDRRLERAVRRRPGDRPSGRDRDEPAGVAVVGARVEGDRLPDRQDRRPARRRLHARRDPQRHHPDATSSTPASFEPVIDYVVTKIPRWAFEKLPGTSGVLGTQMQSVGEVMAIGRTFPESLQKALRSLEQGRLGLGLRSGRSAARRAVRRRAARARRRSPPPIGSSRSASCCTAAFRSTSCTRRPAIDPWFLDQMSMISEERRRSSTPASPG